MTRATREHDGDDLCDPHYAIAVREDGEEPVGVSAGRAIVSVTKRDESPVYTLPVSAIIADSDEDLDLEEITPPKAVEGSTMERICGREGCTKPLTARNNSGFCTQHLYDSKRGAAKKPRKSSNTAMVGAAGNNRIPNAGQPAGTGEDDTGCTEAPETVGVLLTDKHLDNIWSRLSLHDKAALLFAAESLLAKV